MLGFKLEKEDVEEWKMETTYMNNDQSNIAWLEPRGHTVPTMPDRVINILSQKSIIQ